ncbi:hypothetical protein COO60DRAFT_1102993 [Scenedesmus sp. NREL 46B-D3]|nr:hypothetical protein COO60DRAFT_1102993 [Scenedesmus sp. NREL 46B-D3]
MLPIVASVSRVWCCCDAACCGGWWGVGCRLVCACGCACTPACGCRCVCRCVRAGAVCACESPADVMRGGAGGVPPAARQREGLGGGWPADCGACRATGGWLTTASSDGVGRVVTPQHVSGFGLPGRGAAVRLGVCAATVTGAADRGERQACVVALLRAVVAGGVPSAACCVRVCVQPLSWCVVEQVVAACFRCMSPLYAPQAAMCVPSCAASFTRRVVAGSACVAVDSWRTTKCIVRRHTCSHVLVSHRHCVSCCPAGSSHCRSH